MRQNRGLGYYYFILIGLLFAGCASTAADWNRAKVGDTIDGYALFESKHPDSEFAAEAGWEIAKREDTILSYFRFINRYPESRIYDEAKSRLIPRVSVFADNFGTLKTGMSIDDVSELIGPFPESIMKMYKEQKGMGLLSRLFPNSSSSSTFTLRDALFTLEFEGADLTLSKWTPTVAFTDLLSIK